MRITMIGTVHNEIGCANVTTLKSILDRLQPDVIFAEIDSAHLTNFIDGSHGNLESATVALYRELCPVNVIPVDIKKPSNEFFRESMEMFEKIERTSSVYRYLLDQHRLDTQNYGFSYLNSNRCGDVWTNLYRETHETIEWIGSPRLREIHTRWKKTNELRESTMLKKINRYGLDSTLSNGVLLIGTAHRKTMIERIEKLLVPDTTKVFWNYEVLID